MIQQTMWVELRRESGRILVGSNDWLSITLHAPEFTSGEGWSEEDEAIRCTEKDGHGLAKLLEDQGYKACHGSVGRFGSNTFAHATLTSVQSADGLTVQERTRQLAEFLKGGAFTWRYIFVPYEAVEDSEPEW